MRAVEEQRYGREAEAAARDLRLCKALFRVAVADRGKWEEIARLTFPELLEAADLQEENTRPKEGGMPLCDYAATLMQFLTSAHVSYITPLGERWFQFAPWESDAAGDESWMEVGSWYSKATQICQEVLERTNFYTENIATYNDRGVTGTGAMLCEQTAEGEIVFTHVPAGTYGIAENGLHKVDTFVRRFKATPAQMVHLFGEEGLSAETRQAYASEDERYTKQVELYQLIEPRRGKNVSWDVFEQDAGKMPYRSVYIEKASGKVVLESGYTEFPVYVTRFLRYGNYPYGRSALATVLQTMKDLVKLQDMEVTAAARAAVPSVLVTPELVGHVDLRAGGQTVVSAVEGAAGVPREFAPPARLVDLQAAEAALKETLDAAAYKNVLQPVSKLSKQMTASEVQARQSEAIMSFTQSFTQDQADKESLLPRLFCCVLRAGLMPRDGMPQALVEEVTDREGKLLATVVRPPRVQYVGRMAQFLQNNQKSALNATIGELAQMAKETGNGEWMMPLDVTKLVRWKLINSAVPQQCLREPDEVERLQAAQAQAAAAQAQAQAAQAASAANLNNARAYAESSRQ